MVERLFTSTVERPPTRTPASQRSETPRRTITSPSGHGPFSAKPTWVTPGSRVRAPASPVAEAQPVRSSKRSSPSTGSGRQLLIGVAAEAGAHLSVVGPDEVVVSGVVEVALEVEAIAGHQPAR